LWKRLDKEIKIAGHAQHERPPGFRRPPGFFGIGMERMPCGQSYANAVFFRIGVIAYNLFIGFKRLSCPESWMKQTIATFRWKMVQIAGRIVRHAGKTVLKLMIDLEKLELFKEIRRKSFELSLCPDG